MRKHVHSYINTLYTYAGRDVCVGALLPKHCPNPWHALRFGDGFGLDMPYVTGFEYARPAIGEDLGEFSKGPEVDGNDGLFNSAISGSTFEGKCSMADLAPKRRRRIVRLSQGVSKHSSGESFEKGGGIIFLISCLRFRPEWAPEVVVVILARPRDIGMVAGSGGGYASKTSRHRSGRR